MVDAGLVKTRRWVLGAVLTALCSLAYARMPQAPHGGGGGGGFHPGIQHDVRNARAERGRPEDRGVRVAHGADGARGGYNVPQRVAGGAGGYRGNSRADPRNGFQYAGSITPVSAQTRAVPRPPEDESMVRAGSIRADVARYNEERGASRPVPRPPDQYMERPPGPSPYRN
jgi:hypothetical protein